MAVGSIINRGGSTGTASEGSSGNGMLEPPSHPKAVDRRETPQSAARRTALQSDEAKKLDEANRRVRDRVEWANQQVKQAEAESEERINHVRHDYDVQVMREEERNEQSLEAQRQKGYNAIRELQRAQNAELHRLKREGEKQLEELRKYYLDTIYATETKGREDLQTKQTQHAVTSDFMEREHKNQLEESRNMHELQAKSLQQEHTDRLSSMMEKNRKEVEDLRVRTETAEENASEKFQKKYTAAVRYQNEAMGNIFRNTREKLSEIRQDSADRLAGYARRQDDPFYQLRDLEGRFHETPEAYIVELDLPSHEQQNVSVAVRGKQLVISGFRRNEEKQEVAPGHAKATSSYQSYSETFPLRYPVQARQISREAEEGRVRFTVPKLTEYTPYELYSSDGKKKQEKPKPEAAKLEKPQFPSNIPYVNGTAQSETPIPAELREDLERAEAQPRSGRTRTHRTLG
jgi:HSP20 family molecular chaperone IbpA